mgnify:CR=1 FL=1
MDGHARGGVAALLLFVLIGTTVHATTHFKLAPLPYSYDALEPAIDEATMRLHHVGHSQNPPPRSSPSVTLSCYFLLIFSEDKHHQAYTDKFNKAIDEVLALELVVPSLVADNPSPLEILRELLSLPLPVALHTVSTPSSLCQANKAVRVLYRQSETTEVATSTTICFGRL